MNNTDNSHIRIEIKQSVFILFLKLILLIFLSEGLFSLISFFLLDINQFPQGLHSYIHIILLASSITKNLIVTFFNLKIIVNWISVSYFFDLQNKYLVKKEGIINTKEKLYDLKNVRSFSVNQSYLGKLFHYGDIAIETSASGGYQDKVFLIGINNPKQSETILQQCIHQ